MKTLDLRDCEFSHPFSSLLVLVSTDQLSQLTQDLFGAFFCSALVARVKTSRTSSRRGRARVASRGIFADRRPSSLASNVNSDFVGAPSLPHSVP